MTTKDGSLVVVFAAPDRSAINEVITGLTGSLPAAATFTGVQLRRTAQVGAWRMGVGRAHQGRSGVRLSYELAREALDLGARLGGSQQVWDAADLLVQRVLIRDETAMRELVEAVLTPLATARGGAGPLLRTLEAYFAAGGNASLCARSLHLSVRALTYRLAKIADLTGRDPANPVQRFELQSAVTGARLLGVATLRVRSDLLPESGNQQRKGQPKAAMIRQPRHRHNGEMLMAPSLRSLTHPRTHP